MKLATVYKPELANPKSKPFRDYAKLFETALLPIIKAKIPIVEEVRVTRFSSGSIIVDFDVIMAKDTSKNAINPSAVPSAISNVIRSGRLDRFELVWNYATTVKNFNQCDYAHLHNCNKDANCSSDGLDFNCTCKHGFVGNGVECIETCRVKSCPNNSTCKDVMPATCRCRTGYTYKHNMCIGGEMIAIENFHLNLPWKIYYANKTSLEFARFAATIEKTLEKFIKVDLELMITGVQILSLERGSVIIQCIVVFNKTSSLNGTYLAMVLRQELIHNNHSLSLKSLNVVKAIIPVVRGGNACMFTMPCFINEECISLNRMNYTCTCKPGFVRKNGECESEAVKKWQIAVIATIAGTFVVILMAVMLMLCKHGQKFIKAKPKYLETKYTSRQNTYTAKCDIDDCGNSSRQGRNSVNVVGMMYLANDYYNKRRQTTRAQIYDFDDCSL